MKPDFSRVEYIQLNITLYISIWFRDVKLPRFFFASTEHPLEAVNRCNYDCFKQKLQLGKPSSYCLGTQRSIMIFWSFHLNWTNIGQLTYHQVDPYWSILIHIVKVANYFRHVSYTFWQVRCQTLPDQGTAASDYRAECPRVSWVNLETGFLLILLWLGGKLVNTSNLYQFVPQNCAFSGDFSMG